MRGRRLTGACALLLAMAGALAACGSSGSGSATEGDSRGGPLTGRWALTGYASGGAVTAPAAGISADAVFEGGTISGRAPVNTYTGPYTVRDDGTLTIGPVASTQMAGPPAANTAEKAYFDLLDTTAAYSSKDGTLTLFDSTGATVLTFEGKAVSIAGAYEVTGYNNGRQAVVSVAAGSTITADFGEDGSLSGNGGVNTYTSTYETAPKGAAGLTIRVAPIATTRKAGPEALMTQEQEYLAALESAKTVVFDGQGVTLRDASDAIAVTMTAR